MCSGVAEASHRSNMCIQDHSDWNALEKMGWCIRISRLICFLNGIKCGIERRFLQRQQKCLWPELRASRAKWPQQQSTPCLVSQHPKQKGKREWLLEYHQIPLKMTKKTQQRKQRKGGRGLLTVISSSSDISLQERGFEPGISSGFNWTTLGQSRRS